MRFAVCVLVVAFLGSCTRVVDPPPGRNSTPITLAIGGLLSPLPQETLVSVVATNLHTLPSGEADSDGDGLSDSAETILGTSLLDADSDGDGIGDGLEFQRGTSPVEAGVPCLDLTDADGDGLNACEESLLGTQPSVFDSDGDDLSDGLEARAGMEALLDDTSVDYDLDGVTNGDEARQHTQVRLLNARDKPYLYKVTHDAAGTTLRYRVDGIVLAGLFNEAPNLVMLTTAWTTPTGTVHRVACVSLSHADLPHFTEVEVPATGWMSPADLRPSLCVCPAGGC